MKRIIKVIATVLIVILLLVGSGKFLRYILIDDTVRYTRLTFHEMYEQDNIDALFLGSSVCYRTFIPSILDEELNMNTFNAGTSAQAMDGSYMILKEAAKYNDIKKVYLEVYYAISFNGPEDRGDMTQTYIISDYLKPSLDKVQYLLQASGADQYANSFIPARRNWEKLFDLDYIKNVIEKKSTEEYKNYDYSLSASTHEWYAGKGYVANDKTVDNNNYFFEDESIPSIDLNEISENWEENLNNIIDFCDKNGIELTLVASPLSDFLLTAYGNYDEYIAYMKEFIKDKNVKYYDLNLCKEDYFSFDSELYMDEDHVNNSGAEQVSRLFANLINGEVSEEELFYDSYEQKLESIEPEILGIIYEGESPMQCRIVSTKDSYYAYKITVQPENAEAYVVKDYSTDNTFELSEETGQIILEYYPVDAPDNVQSMTITID